MDGQKVYDNKIINKIDNLFTSNPEKNYLRGFYYYLSNDHSYASIYNYLSYVVSFINETNKKPEELLLDDYTRFFNKYKDKVSSYQIAVYSALKLFSLYLLANEMNTKNPMQYINRPKNIENIVTKEKRENAYLTQKEIKTYLQTVKEGVGTHKAKARQEKWKARDFLIVNIFLLTGIRCSALYKLNVNSINLVTKKLITVDKGSLINEFPLDEHVIECTAEWLHEREQILNGAEEDALFISNQRTRLDQSSISRIVNKYAAHIKGKHITPHKLRATYGSSIYDATKDLYLTQQCMRHKNPRTTEIYIRGQKDVSRERGVEIMSKNLKI